MLSLRQRLKVAENSLSYWAKVFINLEHGEKFDFKDHLYLLQPYQDRHPNIVEKKATQLGLSTKAILRAIHGCLYYFPLGVIYYFPTDTDVSDFSKGRVKPFIEKNPDIIGRYIEDTDSVGIKKVGKSFVYFRGMNSKIALKSVPADMIIIDELDEAPPDKIEMAAKRLSHSDFKVRLALSNPSIPGYGIDAEFVASDQNYWLVKCQHCNEWNNLVEDFPDCIINFKDEYIYACKKCHKELDRNKGKWVAKYPDRRDARGYQYSQLISPRISAKEIWKEYQLAIIRGKLQIFYNLTLGLAYVSAREKLTKEQVLELCDAQFPKDPWKLSGPTFMGVDQGRDLHIVFKKRYNDKILTWIAFEQDFEQLDKYMKKGVQRCVIDALPETRKAREFAIRHPGRVFLNFYNKHQKGSIKWIEDDKKQDWQCEENRTESLDTSHSDYQNKINVLPPRSPEIEEFAEHCKNIAKKLEEDDETGSRRYVWVKLGDDHYRHADNYAKIALSAYNDGMVIWSIE